MILFCADTSELKLGPGAPGSEMLVVFHDHYATIADDDPLLQVKLSWISHPGTPPIRVLDEDEAPVTAAVITCPVCAEAGVTKAFATDKQLNGHLLHHRKKE